MPSYLSDEWLAALDAAARNHAGLAAATAGVHLVLEQVVTSDTADPDLDTDPGGSAGGGGTAVCWHVVVDDGSVRFVGGPAPAPTVRFTADAVTARAVTDGALSATEAFMTGRLRVGGDTTALVEHHALLEGLGDVFAAVGVD